MNREGSQGTSKLQGYTPVKGWSWSCPWLTPMPVPFKGKYIGPWTLSSVVTSSWKSSCIPLSPEFTEPFSDFPPPHLWFFPSIHHWHKTICVCLSLPPLLYLELSDGGVGGCIVVTKEGFKEKVRNERTKEENRKALESRLQSLSC